MALANGAGHVDAVEIDPKIQQLGHRLPPRPPVPGSAGHPLHQRRPRLPAQHRQEVRPGHLRPARLADPGQLDRQHPARVIPVHPAVVRVGPRSPVARRRVRRLQLLPRQLADLEDRHDAHRRVRQPADHAVVRRVQGDLRRRPARSTRSTAAPPPADSVGTVPDAGDPVAEARHRRLAVPVPADAVHRRRTTSPASRSRCSSACSASSARRASAARRSAGSARTSSCSAPRSCCSRHDRW